MYVAVPVSVPSAAPPAVIDAVWWIPVCTDPFLSELVVSNTDSYVPTTRIADGDADPPGEEAAGDPALGIAIVAAMMMDALGEADPEAVGDGPPEAGADAHAPMVAARVTAIANEREVQFRRARCI